MKCPKCGAKFSKKDEREGRCPFYGFDCDYEVSTAKRLAARKAERIAKTTPEAPKPNPVPARVKVEVKVAYEVSIDSAGYIRDEGFDVRDADTDNPRLGLKGQNLVVVLTDGRVFVGNSVLTKVSGSYAKAYAPKTILTFGRAKLYQVTEYLIDKLLDDQSYPSRNDREAEVKERNTNIVVWLASQAGF